MMMYFHNVLKSNTDRVGLESKQRKTCARSIAPRSHFEDFNSFSFPLVEGGGLWSGGGNVHNLHKSCIICVFLIDQKS